MSPEPTPTEPSRRPWPRTGLVKRWGVVCVVLAALIAVGVVATVRTPSAQNTATATTSGDPTKNPELPITYGEAQKQGTVAKYDWGSRCDTKTGRLKMPSIYATPCVPAYQPAGGNGGATWNGVTADTVKVVWYIAPPNDLAASLQSKLDPQEAQNKTVEQFVDMLNHVSETYGRKVQIVFFTGTGVGTDETAARADAVKVADDIHAFASIGGPAQTDAYSSELAARHVLCIACGSGATDEQYQQNAPYNWGIGPTSDQYTGNALDFAVKDLNGRKAAYAGDAAMRDRTRAFGIVHYDQNPPLYGDLTKTFNEKYGKSASLKANLSYLLDIPTLADQATSIVGKLKQAGVTTVVFLGDPIMPIYLTKAATAQNYFPEWVETGTVLTDASALARLYDPKQWSHAFGLTYLPARVDLNLTEAWSLYRWYYATTPPAPKTVQVIWPGIQLLFQGLQLAGPKLTPTTFEGGLFKAPPVGGGPTTPRVSFGHHGVQQTPDFTTVDDFALIWWDATAKGPDEQGKDGAGMYRYVDGGRRYLPGQLPKTPPPFFSDAGTVTIYNQIPPQGQPPPEPPWPGSPAAARAGSSPP